MDKQFWLTIVSFCNGIFAVITSAEVIHLLVKQFSCFTPQSYVTWSGDLQFTNEYFLRKKYVPAEIELIVIKNFTPNSCDVYKRKVWKLCLTQDINYGWNKRSLDYIFIDVVIHTEEVPHKFSKEMTRHEIYNVYMKVSVNLIYLKEMKDLFYENKDTDWFFPNIISVIGCPGIGKTVLTRKIMRDWGNGQKKLMKFIKIGLQYTLNSENSILLKRDTCQLKSLYSMTLSE